MTEQPSIVAPDAARSMITTKAPDYAGLIPDARGVIAPPAPTPSADAFAHAVAAHDRIDAVAKLLNGMFAGEPITADEARDLLAKISGASAPQPEQPAEVASSDAGPAAPAA